MNSNLGLKKTIMSVKSLSELSLKAILSDASSDLPLTENKVISLLVSKASNSSDQIVITVL